MPFKTYLATAACALSATGVASAAHIDFFNEGNVSPLFLNGGSSATETYTDADPGTPAILGNSRKATLTYAPGPSNGLIVESITETGDGQLSFSNGSNTQGTLILDYFLTVNTGVDLVGSGGALPYDSFEFDVASLDDPFDITIEVTDTFGATSTASTVVATPGSTFFPYFLLSGADLTSVETLSFSFTGTVVAADINIDGIFRATTVPEPTAALGVAGLLGLVGMRRRR